ncbi:MAG TPA: glycosyltransferase 87 family protein [Thermoanaerobaculia bacterium]
MKLAALVAAGIAIRLAILATTFGTTDAALVTAWARFATEHGVAGAYAQHTWVNHPPLSLALMQGLYGISAKHFADLFRLQQVLADCVSFACLLALGSRRVALLYFLSPVAIFISAFHGNSDATMVMFVLLALVLLQREQPFAAGIALGAAIGIKIVPLLLMPLVVAYLWKRAATAPSKQALFQFALSFAITAGLMFAIPLSAAGTTLVSNVFGYRGVGTWWGFVSMAILGHAARAAELYIAANTFVELALVAALAWWFWRRTEASLQQLIAMCGVMLGAVIVLGAGFGVQYLIWPVAFLPFALRTREAVALHAVLGVFLAIVYTHWSGGLPWSYANALNVTTNIVMIGWVAWAALAAACVRTMGQIGRIGPIGQIGQRQNPEVL